MYLPRVSGTGERDSPTRLPQRSLPNEARTRPELSTQGEARSPVPETLARRDAGAERTGMYLPRVSGTGERDSPTRLPQRSLPNEARTRPELSTQGEARSPVPETLARRDAGAERTGMYLPRVSGTGERDSPTRLPQRSLPNEARTRPELSTQGEARSPVPETLARRDAGAERTGMYLPRVSGTGERDSPTRLPQRSPRTDREPDAPLTNQRVGPHAKKFAITGR